MISPFAILHGNPLILKMLELIQGSHLSGVQLVGSDPKAMAEAAKMIESMGYDYVDINMGCTVKTVAENGGGITLMRNVEKAQEIVSAIIRAVNIPVTCKLRLGLSSNNRNSVELARRLQDTGVSAITIHGRTGEKKFGLKVEPKGIREVVETVNVPIIANGGIYTGEDAAEMLKNTGATAVMPGRGVIGNPWIIPEIEAAVTGSNYYPPNLDERRRVCLIHLDRMIEHYSDLKGIISFRRILPKYFTGCINNGDLKRDMQHAKTIDDVNEMLARLHEDGAHLFYND
jgi:tRNA-dihydrouridine synthase B